jgi:transmembrane sensor
MPMPDGTPAQVQVDQAIDWLVKAALRHPSPRTEQQFQQWLASHPHNPWPGSGSVIWATNWPGCPRT